MGGNYSTSNETRLKEAQKQVEIVAERSRDASIQSDAKSIASLIEDLHNQVGNDPEGDQPVTQQDCRS